MGSYYPWAAVWGLNDVKWWCETLHWDRDSSEGPTAQPALPHTHGGAATALLPNVVPGDSSVDKGMSPHSRNTLDEWLIPCPPGTYEEWCCFGGAVHIHSTRPLSAICSKDGKSQQCPNLSHGCASIKRRNPGNLLSDTFRKNEYGQHMKI